MHSEPSAPLTFQQPQQHQRGVVGRLSGFSCAVTQFLDTEGMAALSMVCKEDKRITDQIWSQCERLLDGGGVSLHCMLYRQTHPVCLAFAHIKALWLVRSFLDNEQWRCNGLLLGTDDPIQMGFYSAFRIYSTRGEWVIERTLGHRDPYVQLMRRIFADIHSQRSFEEQLSQCKCAQLLLRYLLVAGPLFTFAMVDHDSLLEPFVTLWFALGVAPRLPVELAILPSMPVGSVLATYHDHIDYRVI